MRTTRISFIGIVLAMLIIGLIPPTSAARTQWFPEAGTTVSYSVSHYLSFANGSATECTEFYLYNDSGTAYFAIPTILRRYFSPLSWPGTLLTNHTQLTIRHTYSEQSATQLKKVVTVIWDGGSVAVHGKSFFLFLIESATGYNYFSTYTSNSILPKDGFPSYWDYVSFYFLHDYINASAGLLEPTPYLIRNVMISPDYIIARLEMDIISANFTYIANGNGKVLSSGCSSATAEITALGLRCASYAFDIIVYEADDEIPAFPLIWTLIALATSILFIINLSKRGNIKLKSSVA